MGTALLSGAVALASVAIISVRIARTLTTPSGERPERVQILGTGDGTVTLKADPDTLTPGVFSLYWGNRAGHARIGAILAHDRSAGTVIRIVEQVYTGSLEPGTTGYWSGYAYPSPNAIGLIADDVILPGPAPAWLIRGRDSGRWVIHIHGLGGRRATGVRTTPLFDRLGFTQLLISYRGDGDAPATPDGKHHLGHTEMDDVEAALDYAAANGATSIILSGWSMGAAMALAATHSSHHRRLVSGLVLTAPVLSWRRTLAFNTAAARLPAFLADVALWVLRSPLHRVAGTGQPLDLRPLDLTQFRPHVPVLILHSEADSSTPISISAAYAATFSDQVHLVPFPAGRHTQEWNADRRLWEDSVEAWLAAQS